MNTREDKYLKNEEVTLSRTKKNQALYEEMSEEAVAEFYKIYESHKAANKDYELEVFSNYQNGLISKEEMFEQVGASGFSCYQSARSEFNRKYNYYPIKVPVYELSAF